MTFYESLKRIDGNLPDSHVITSEDLQAWVRSKNQECQRLWMERSNLYLLLHEKNGRIFSHDAVFNAWLVAVVAGGDGNRAFIHDSAFCLWAKLLGVPAEEMIDRRFFLRAFSQWFEIKKEQFRGWLRDTYHVEVHKGDLYSPLVRVWITSEQASLESRFSDLCYQMRSTWFFDVQYAHLRAKEDDYCKELRRLGLVGKNENSIGNSLAFIDGFLEWVKPRIPIDGAGAFVTLGIQKISQEEENLFSKLLILYDKQYLRGDPDLYMETFRLWMAQRAKFPAVPLMLLVPHDTFLPRHWATYEQACGRNLKPEYHNTRSYWEWELGHRAEFCKGRSVEGIPFLEEEFTNWLIHLVDSYKGGK